MLPLTAFVVYIWRPLPDIPMGEGPGCGVANVLPQHPRGGHMTTRDVLQAFWKWQEDEAFIGYRLPLLFEDYLTKI